MYNCLYNDQLTTTAISTAISQLSMPSTQQVADAWYY